VNDIPHVIEVCTDCLFLLANGEAFEWQGADYVDITEEHTAKMRAVWNDWHISLGCSDPECTDGPNELDTEPWFSGQDCDGCGSSLGGDRQHATAWEPVVTTKEIA